MLPCTRFCFDRLHSAALFPPSLLWSARRGHHKCKLSSGVGCLCDDAREKVKARGDVTRNGQGRVSDTHVLKHDAAAGDGAIFVRPLGEETVAIRPALHDCVAQEQRVVRRT